MMILKEIYIYIILDIIIKLDRYKFDIIILKIYNKSEFMIFKKEEKNIYIYIYY